MQADIDASRVRAMKVLADPLRWRVVELLADEELCVCHLVEELGVPQPLISHHLRVLREAGLVETERFRYWTYYRLLPSAFAALARQLEGIGTSASPRGRRPCC